MNRFIVNFKKKLNSKFSIKIKITLWYMILMTGLIIIFLGTIFYISNNLVRNSAYANLKDIVDKSFMQITYKKNNLEIDDDLETLTGNIQLSIFNKDKEFIYGNSPLNFDFDDTLTDNGEIKIVKNLNKRWYIYETKKIYDGYGELWIRGVVESSVIEYTLETIIFISLISLPFFLFFTGLTGYIILKNSFKPIEQIRDAAQEINNGNDLTKRINLGDGTNEVYTLANTFDTMFDKLQTSFDNEVQFTSDVSHELRTSISVIMSQSEYGKEYISSIEESKNIFDIIFKESKKMSILVSQLLILARMDKGHQKINLEEVEIGELIEISIESQKLLAKEKNIEIISNIQENIYSLVDETMIMRVFNNLISNSISYGKENGYIRVYLYKDENNIITKIEDNGIGISKENLEKIWIRFFQVDPSRTTENSGLGLSMVKSILEAHKGHISVESELNKGTTFTLYLPILMNK